MVEEMVEARVRIGGGIKNKDRKKRIYCVVLAPIKLLNSVNIHIAQTLLVFSFEVSHKFLGFTNRFIIILNMTEN
jgi:hypothetical protein